MSQEQRRSGPEPSTSDPHARIRPRELDTAARITEGLVYAVAIAGVVAGALLYREGQLGFAVVAWVMTFAAGTVLRLAAWGARALAELLIRTRSVEEDLASFRATLASSSQTGPEGGQGPPDPYRRWSGWH